MSAGGFVINVSVAFVSIMTVYYTGQVFNATITVKNDAQPVDCSSGAITLQGDCNVPSVSADGLDPGAGLGTAFQLLSISSTQCSLFQSDPSTNPLNYTCQGGQTLSIGSSINFTATYNVTDSALAKLYYENQLQDIIAFTSCYGTHRDPSNIATTEVLYMYNPQHVSACDAQTDGGRFIVTYQDTFSIVPTATRIQGSVPWGCPDNQEEDPANEGSCRCKQGYVQDPNNPHTCINSKCSPPQVLISGNCSFCTPLVYSNGNCVPCPLNQIANQNATACICSSNQVLDTTTSQCVCVGNNTVTTNQNCTCPNNLIFLSDNINCGCPAGLIFSNVPSNLTCICPGNLVLQKNNNCACGPNQISISSTQCASCVSPATFVNNSCVCPSDQIQLNSTTCSNCSSVSILDSNSKQCVPCPKTQIKSTASTCKCPLNTVLFNQTTCVSTNCTNNTTFDSSKGTCVCPAGETFINSTTCSNCGAFAIYNTKTKNCVACPTNQIKFNATQCTECNSTTIYSSKTKTCVNCPANKVKISCTDCASCSSPAVYSNGQCVCPANQVLIPNNPTRCSKCRDETEIFDFLSISCKECPSQKTKVNITTCLPCNRTTTYWSCGYCYCLQWNFISISRTDCALQSIPVQGKPCTDKDFPQYCFFPLNIFLPACYDNIIGAAFPQPVYAISGSSRSLFDIWIVLIMMIILMFY